MEEHEQIFKLQDVLDALERDLPERGLFVNERQLKDAHAGRLDVSSKVQATMLPQGVVVCWDPGRQHYCISTIVALGKDSSDEERGYALSMQWRLLEMYEQTYTSGTVLYTEDDVALVLHLSTIVPAPYEIFYNGEKVGVFNAMCVQAVVNIIEDALGTAQRLLDIVDNPHGVVTSETLH